MINMFDIIKKVTGKNGSLSSQLIRSLSDDDKLRIKNNPNLISKSFPEHLYWHVHGLIDYPQKCKCGKPITKFYSFNRGYIQNYCSLGCMQKDPTTQKKKNSTILKKYSVTSIWKVPEIIARREQTCFVRFGEKNSMGIARSGSMEKYGVDHVSKIPGVLQRRIDSIFKKSKQKYKDKNFLISEYKGYFVETSATCTSCGTILFEKPALLHCEICNPKDKTIRSKLESRILDAIQEKYNGKILVNKKFTLSGKNYVIPDLYFPEKKLVVETDGNYWHAELRGGDKLKSLQKSRAYLNCGLTSLFFFEDEILFSQEKVVSIILAKLGVFNQKVFARNTEVREIDSNTSKMFLDLHHLQNNASASIQLGLFLRDKLLAVATFRKPRFTKSASHELVRLCFLPGVQIVGGASKLLKFFRKNNRGTLLSYSDNRFSGGLVYEALGFKLKSVNQPAYYYMHRKDYLVRLNRMAMQKKTLLRMGGDANLTEWENAQNFDFDRIWDCGSKTWILD